MCLFLDHWIGYWSIECYRSSLCYFFLQDKEQNESDASAGEVAAVCADGEKDVSADQVTSCHITRMPHFLRRKCEKQCFTLLSQTLCELQAKESKVAPKQTGTSTSTSDIWAGGVKSGELGLNLCQTDGARSALDDLEDGHLSDNEGEDGPKEKKMKKKDKSKKKKKKAVMLLVIGYCLSYLSTLQRPENLKRLFQTPST